MSGRNFTQFSYGLEKKRVNLFADMTVPSPATGSPTLVATKNKGIKSIVRNSAGNYTITLQDKYQRVLSVKANIIPVSGVSQVVGCDLVSRDVDNVVVQFKGPTGGTPDVFPLIAKELTAGDVVLFEISLSDSTAL